MRHRTVLLAAAAALLVSVPPPVTAQGRDAAGNLVGSVERLQFTSLTRTEAAVWVHTLLPEVSDGSKQSFTGDVEIANVKIPVRKPLTVAVQARPDRNEAVFFLDVALNELPEALLTNVGSHALDVTLTGRLTGEKGADVRVFAAGVLRFGTPDIHAPWAAVDSFVRFGGARLTGLSLKQTKGEAKISLFNPLGFSIPVKEIKYTLTSGDRTLCGGEVRSVRIHPGRENSISLPITAQNADLVAAAGKAVANGGLVDGRLTGSITFRVGRGDITLPINLPGKIQLVK